MDRLSHRRERCGKYSSMDDKDFRKHLRDLAHGHHHPEEHDWSGGSAGAVRAPAKAKAAKPSKKKKAKR